MNVKVTKSAPLRALCCHFTVCPVLLSFLLLCLLSQSASSGSHQWLSQPMSLFPPNTAMCCRDFRVHTCVLLQVGVKVWFREHRFKINASLPAMTRNLTV